MTRQGFVILAAAALLVSGCSTRTPPPLEPPDAGGVGIQSAINIDPPETEEILIDAMDTVGTWAVVNADAGALTTDTATIAGGGSLEFDKLNGAPDTVFALIADTITATDFTATRFTPVSVQTWVNIPDLADVVNVVLRLGTDASNYNEWRRSVSGHTAGAWERVVFQLNESAQGSTGSGWDPASVTYIAVGVQFTAETDTLTDILWDAIYAVTPLNTTAQNVETFEDIASNTETTSDGIDALNSGLADAATHGALVEATGLHPALEAKDIDGGALPVTASEGQAIRAAGTLWGGTIVYVASEDGSSPGEVHAVGDVAHDAANSGNPVQIGGQAESFGTTPTAAADDDRTRATFSRGGALFTAPGAPNMLSRECRWADADNAQTNTACITVAGGTLIVVHGATVTCDNANTGDVAVRVGFAAATLPSSATTGVDDVLLAHDGVPAGGGQSEQYGVGIPGADGEDVRYTAEDPAGGACTLRVSYYTIAG